MWLSDLVSKHKYMLSLPIQILWRLLGSGGCTGKEEHITGTDDQGSKYCAAFVAKQINNEEIERVSGSKFC